jgi:hypothetical protein
VLGTDDCRLSKQLDKQLASALTKRKLLLQAGHLQLAQTSLDTYFAEVSRCDEPNHAGDWLHQLCKAQHVFTMSVITAQGIFIVHSA